MPRTPQLSDIGKKQLTPRQRELLGYVQVSENVAVFGKDEIIPDWKALKTVMVALGGEWRSRKGFVFPSAVDASLIVETARATGYIIDPKEADFYETPGWLADALAEDMLHPIDDASDDPMPGFTPRRILEPSAGKGALALAARKRWPKAEIVCIEALAAHAAVLRTLGFETYQGDFMSFHVTQIGPVDAVIMNPPFTGRQDILHVEHAFTFLNAPGALTAIMAAGVDFRTDLLSRQFRSFVTDHGGCFHPNQDHAFRPSGTDVRTVTCRLWRRP